MKSVLRVLSKRGPLRVLKRVAILIAYLGPSMRRGILWSFKRTEDSNFYYDITERNLRHLNHFVADSCGVPFEAAKSLSDEIRDSEEFSNAVEAFKQDRPGLTSFSFALGRRIGWYQLVRITKPKVVLETGVHQGAGALTICLALKRNAQEGHPGRYIGTDINSKAGELIADLGFEFAEVKIGDSIESIESLDCEVDLYISDSDHTAGYEKLELLAVEKKLAKGGLVISDNAHATDVLEEWSVERGRRFNFFSESPRDHWYPGAGIGLSAPK